MAADVLFEELSPNGNITAFVEQDERVAFFYLFPGEDTGQSMKVCWIRNLSAAPDDLDLDAMEQGQPPLLPRAHCAHPAGAEALEPTRLSVVWFEEGDAAALFEGTDLLAVIPAWSGVNDFHGYARDCRGESPLCWALPCGDGGPLVARIRRARECREAWEADPGPWPALQKQQVEAYEQVLGPRQNYYTIDGGRWPPKAMLRIARGEQTCLATVGMCLRPQPAVELQLKDPQAARRIELGLCVANELGPETVEKLMKYVSGQSALPWALYTWLGDGHTVTCDAFPAGAGAAFRAMLLLAEPPGAPDIPLPPYRGDPVTVLWMVPITERERALAVEHGSAALVHKLQEAGYGWVGQPRQEVIEP